MYIPPLKSTRKWRKCDASRHAFKFKILIELKFVKMYKKISQIMIFLDKNPLCTFIFFKYHKICYFTKKKHHNFVIMDRNLKITATSRHIGSHVTE